MHTESTISHNFESVETYQSSEWLNSVDIVDSFQDDPAFVQYLSSNGANPEEKKDPRYINLFANYVTQFCTINLEQHLLDTDSAQQIQLLTETPRMILDQRECHTLEEQRSQLRRGEIMPTNEFRRLGTIKRRLVAYNQRLSSYLHDHPEELHGAIVAAFTEHSLKYFQDQAQAARYIDSTVKGALFEAVSLQSLEQFGLPVRPATSDEDLKGADIILELGPNLVSIDIKSSLDQIASVHGDYSKIDDESKLYAITPSRKEGVPPSIKIYPGFTLSDLKGKCSLPDEKVTEVGSIVSAQLMRAVQEMNQA